jgi:hypothetical protein
MSLRPTGQHPGQPLPSGHDCSAVADPAKPADPPRRRGRPRKTKLNQPDRRSFDDVAAAIAAIPSKDRGRAKALARRLITRDAQLSPTAVFYAHAGLEWLNWEKGKDWHGIPAYMEEVCRGRTMIKAARVELVRAGHVKLRAVPSSKGDWDHSEMTFPVILNAIAAEEGVGRENSGGGLEKIEGVGRENGPGVGRENGPKPAPAGNHLRENHQTENHKLAYGSGSCGPEPAGRPGHISGKTEDPGYNELRDWRLCEFFAEREIYSDILPLPAEDKPTITHDEWRKLIMRIGGRPGRLTAADAYRQAIELASELQQVAFTMCGQVIKPDDCVIGVAFAIAKAQVEGKQINLLGFIAERLIRSIEGGDDSWLESAKTAAQARRPALETRQALLGQVAPAAGPATSAGPAKPAADAPTDPDLAVLYKADSMHLLGPSLLRDPARFQSFIKEQVAKQGCSPADVVAAIAQVLRDAATPDKAALADVLRGRGRRITGWWKFDSAITTAMRRKDQAVNAQCDQPEAVEF